jgi:chemotaxis signal transduction protein
MSAEESRDPLGELIAVVDGEIAAGPAPPPATLPAAPPSRRHLLFSLAGTRYAVALDRLVELGLPPRTTPVPQVPDWVRGVANLRGDVIAVVDLAAFFGLEPASGGGAARLLVVRDGRGEAAAGLLVDEVHGLVSLAEPEAPADRVADRVAPFLAGVAEHRDRLVAVVDLERFFNSPEVRQFEPG